MANPLYSAMNTPKINPQLKQLYNLMKSGGNPMQILGQTPKGREIIQMLQNGMNPQQLFYQECQKQGINPDDILNQLK